MFRFFFCFNQVSYVLAYEALKGDSRVNCIIIMEDRVTPHSESGVVTLKYNPLIALVLLISSSIFRSIEIVLPHAKAGRLIRKMAFYSKRLSFIDDGMDTFRDQPKNIELNLLNSGARYYSFRYKIPVAQWLEKLDFVGVCDISKLMDDVKPTLVLDGYDCLVIESPGVTLGLVGKKYEKVFYIRHPSFIKNQSLSIKIDFENGKNCSAEKTISEFSGNLVIGESMALIFSLHCCQDKSKIHIYLDQQSFDNLSCLHDEFSGCGSIHIGCND